MLLAPLPPLRWLAAVIGLFVVLGVTVYGSSLQFGFVNFDDNMLVSENPAVQTFSPSSVAFVFTHFDPELYIPLTFVSYQMDDLIGGGGSTMFHVTNLVLHILNALLITWLLFSLIRSGPIAVLLGALFLVHPLNTETVMWISARKDLLSTFFALSSIVAYLRYQDTDKRRDYVISFVLFLLGLLSKVMILTLPILLVVIDLMTERPINRKTLTEKLPYLALSCIFGVIGLFGKTQVIGESDILSGVLMATKAVLFYLTRFVWPVGLSVVYPYTDHISFMNVDLLLPFVICLGIAALTVWLFLRHRRIAAGMLFFLIAVAPTFLNYHKAGDIYVAVDRYAYLPSIGLLCLLGWGIAFVLQKSPRLSMPLLYIGLLAIAGMGGVAHARSAVWESTQTLFVDAVAKYPNSHLAHAKVGAGYRDLGQPELAMQHLQQSIELKPTARAYYNVGLLALDEGDLERAIKANQLAISTDPDYASAYLNLGYLYWQTGKKEDAKEALRTAIALEPFAIDAKLNLAVILYDEGDRRGAAKLAEDVLAIDPTNGTAQKLTK